jgi:hypothetical protein
MTAAKQGTKGQDPLELAFQRLQGFLPPRLARALRWVHHPQSRYVRIPLGILCIIASFFWFLPVIGLEYLPIGLLLIAQDVPFMRAPVGRFMLRLLDELGRLRRWWRRWRAQRQQ